MNYQKIIETINQLFISVDNKEWSRLEEIFDENVLLDYTSMNGGTPTLLPSIQIINSWKNFLPYFDATHHQLGNYIIQDNNNVYQVYCYVIATHYLVNESNNNIWSVVGSYNLELIQKSHTLYINKMKFNMKYTDGNNELPNIAQERAKNK